MSFNSQIESSEYRLKQVLEDYFVSEFDERSLPSHGLEHHRRVWEYCKEITVTLRKRGHPFKDLFFDNLIVAAYLHDIGMIVDSGPRHGKHSREMCTHFLKINRLNIEDFHEALEIIEYHDRKDYE
ncbi:MAG TPA: HD domain-containing protein, partial [Bacteroidales bacterium]|nr:HD domain-containing protein [Bacteroidales bacterium]